ncbi:MAG TPA: transcriptional regulator [Ohtaekwangia sp.]|nr:transcriptional regulator [Ohtaekwangia sp.]
MAKSKTPKRKKEAPFIPQTKLLRLFQIIAVLKTGHWSIQQLAERFDTSKRTMYRYMKILEQVEFLVETDFSNRYFIVTSDDDPTQAQFTVAEMGLIKNLIKSTAADTPVKNSLLRKLSLNSEIDSMPRLFLKARLSKFVEQLSEAIRARHQVIFKSYHSANSNEIRDRLVEPIHFGDNFQSIIALDTQDKVCKQFKLDRIGEVVEMEKSYAFESLHQKTGSDIFGYSGDAGNWITLWLSLRAYLLLREEFPLSIPYIEKLENGYHFHGPVASFEGVGRFVLGLLDEIRVSAPESFKDYIRRKLETHHVLQ